MFDSRLNVGIGKSNGMQVFHSLICTDETLVTSTCKQPIQLVHIVPRREPTPWSVLLSYVSAQMLRVRFSRTGERLLSWSLSLIMKII